MQICLTDSYLELDSDVEHEASIIPIIDANPLSFRKLGRIAFLVEFVQ